jgi:hypothetical protein
MSNFAYSKDEVSKLAKYAFEPYMPGTKLKICITGAGGFIASHLAKRLKEEGHHIVACDWKRNEHMPVSSLYKHKKKRLPLFAFRDDVLRVGWGVPFFLLLWFLCLLFSRTSERINEIKN